MQLILNTYGTLLRVKDGNFQIVTEDRNTEIAPRKIASILITTGVRLSSDVIKLALEWNIDIVFLDRHGDPYGRVWHCRLGSTTTIRRRQLEVAQTSEGAEMVRDILSRKLENQIDHLRDLRKRRTRKSETITEGIAKLEELRPLVQEIRADKIELVRERILGIEGTAGRIYFRTLSAALPEPYQFDGRSRNPARDYFNCLLNYAYGVLYSLVERSCILAGLDPYTGILHTDNYNKRSMVFDLIEPYRVWAEDPVVSLLSGRKVKSSDFEQIQGGYTLNKDGKILLLGRLNQHLDEAVRYRGRNIKRRDIVQFDCHRLANQLIKKEEKEMAPQQEYF